MGFNSGFKGLKINIPKYETSELLAQLPSSGLSAAVLVKLKKMTKFES